MGSMEIKRSLEIRLVQMVGSNIEIYQKHLQFVNE